MLERSDLSGRLTMSVSRVRFTLRRMMVALALLLILGALADRFRNHRRVVQFQAAWAYDTQSRECHRLAEAYCREAAREEQEAQHWPEGSEQRQSHLDAAAFHNSQRAGVQQVGKAAHEMATSLRRLARVEP
jgi:hypothetical protein